MGTGPQGVGPHAAEGMIYLHARQANCSRRSQLHKAQLITPNAPFALATPGLRAALLLPPVV